MNAAKPQKLYAVYMIEYGYVPTNMASNKVVYLTMYFPPEGLKVGQLVKLHSADPDFVMPSDALRIKDISGTRVILEPLSQTSWGGDSHGWYWGYSTRQYDALPGMARNWIYGSGKPTVYLVC